MDNMASLFKNIELASSNNSLSLIELSFVFLSILEPNISSKIH